MKKILSLLILTIFFFNITPVFASEKYLEKSYKSSQFKILILSKNNLKKTIKGKKYINIIDSFIEKNKLNKTKLEEISKKIQPVLVSGNIKNKETLDIIKYMDSKINISLIQIYEIEKNDIFKETISLKDKKIIEDKIVILQLNALNKADSIIENITKEFENITNYQEKGDFEFSTNFESNNFGNFKGGVALQNYDSLISGSNLSLKGEIKSFIDISMGSENTNIKFDSLIEAIIKDDNLYLLLEKINFKSTFGGENMEEIEEVVEKFKEAAKDKKYIEYINNNSFSNSLKALGITNPETIYKDTKNILSKPLVEAYKKEGNKYFLKPTKYACDLFKKTSNKFDPFSPGECSEKQYKKLLGSLSDTGLFYAEILKNNQTKIGFTANKSNGPNTNEGFIIFDNKRIIEAKYDFINTFGVSKIDYKYLSHLNLNVQDSLLNNKIVFKSKLNTKNTLKEFIFKFNYSKLNLSKSDLNIELKNNKIVGDFSLEELSYNYIDNKYVSTSFISGSIKGKTKRNNVLEKLDIAYKTIDSKPDNMLVGDFSYNNGDFTFTNNYIKKGMKEDFNLSGKFDNKGILNSGNIDYNYYKQLSSYNYETNKYEYGDFENIINIDITIDNKKINGASTYNDRNGEEILTINHSGNYGKDYFKLDNDFEINADIFGLYGKTGKGNFNMDLDFTKNNNNYNYFIDLVLPDMVNFEMKLKNISTRKYKKINIKAPKNTIKFEDLFKENSIINGRVYY